MPRAFFLIFLMVLAAPLAAQDDAAFRFGDDAYLAGQSVLHSGDPVDDLFAAGETVSSRAGVTGSAHMAGRVVTVEDTVGASLYAAGMRVEVSAPVGGDALLLGDTVTVTGAIGGDLRAAGSRVELRAPVGDAALLAGETVLIDARIAGDVSLAADRAEFGDGAVIDGVLNLYHNDPDAIEVPASVIAADRIVRHPVKEWQGVGVGDVIRVTWWDIAKRVIGGILAVALAATILAALAPDFIAGLRASSLARPVRTIWMGFLSLSAVAGSLILFAMTGIGLLLVPVSVVAALILGFAGYVVGAYVLGVGLIGAVGRPMPDSLGERAIAALVGALVASLVALVPLIGWLFAMGLMLMGAGALIVRFFAPGFHTSRA